MSLRVSGGEKFGSSLAGWFWPRASSEVAVKLSPRATGSSSNVAHSHGWQVGAGDWPGASISFAMGLSTGCLSILTERHLASPRGGVPRGQGRSSSAFYFAVMLLTSQGQPLSVWKRLLKSMSIGKRRSLGPCWRLAAKSSLSQPQRVI